MADNTTEGKLEETSLFFLNVFYKLSEEKEKEIKEKGIHFFPIVFGKHYAITENEKLNRKNGIFPGDKSQIVAGYLKS